jgi:WD40 repeat protein
MPSMRSSRGLSSQEVRKLWRYAVASDFRAIDTSIETDEQILGYGTEDRFLPFHHPIGKSWFTHSINSSGRLLAIPDKTNVDIYDLITGDRAVLSGHTSEVGTVGFSPTNPDVLVSYSNGMGMGMNNRDDDERDEIIMWNVQEQKGAEKSRTNAPIDQAAKVGVQAALAHLGDTLQLSSRDSDEIQDTLKALLRRCDTCGRVGAASRLKGRISTSFQSPLFSNSGEYLIYGPDARPRSNSDDKWDLCLFHITTRVTTTLSGHRDSIMWTGFSPDDTLIASAGWDGFFRVHDVNGKEVWKWDTEKQNWAAVFSPDSKYLAGTDGAGIVRIWNLKTGEETAKFDNGPRWCRAIDWSPDGNYIVVGSEDHGRLRLFAFSDGKIEMVQERILSTKNSNLEGLDPQVRGMVCGFIGVVTARFLPSPEGAETSTRLVHSASLDEGIEVFDFDRGKKRRFVPPYNEDGSVAVSQAGDGQHALLGHIWRKETGEIGIISRDGIRFWRLD